MKVLDTKVNQNIEPNYRILDLEQGSNEWLDYRKNKITASIVADCIGIKGAFRSQKERALIMQGLKQEYFSAKQLEAMEKGTRAESLMREIVSAKSGETIYKGGVYESLENPLFLCSLDGVGFESKAIYEFKYSKLEYDFVKKNKRPSEKYYTQVQFQLMIVNTSPYAIFGVMNPSDEVMEIVLVERDESFIKDMLNKLESFQNDFLYQELKADEAELNDSESIALACELLEIKERIKGDLEREKEIKELLVKKGQNLGEKCSCNGVLIYPSTRKSVDYKGFLESKKLIVDESFIKESTSWSVRA